MVTACATRTDGARSRARETPEGSNGSIDSSPRPRLPELSGRATHRPRLSASEDPRDQPTRRPRRWPPLVRATRVAHCSLRAGERTGPVLPRPRPGDLSPFAPRRVSPPISAFAPASPSRRLPPCPRGVSWLHRRMRKRRGVSSSSADRSLCTFRVRRTVASVVVLSADRPRVRPPVIDCGPGGTRRTVGLTASSWAGVRLR